MESANEKKDMQSARDCINLTGEEFFKKIDPDSLDPENLKVLEKLLEFYKNLQAGEREIQNMIAKNQKTQQKIFFFFAILFFSEICYSLAIGSGYVEPINLKALMLVFIFLLMAFAYTQFRK